MSDRDEILAYLGLSAHATFSEIEHAYIVRCNSAGERVVAGDESARDELVALKEAFGHYIGRIEHGEAPGAGPQAGPGETHLRAPAWWECYLSLLVALTSLGALVTLAILLPHVYHRGGFLIPLALIVSAGLLSIFATMLSEAELQHGRRRRLLRSRGIGDEAAGIRFQVARCASVLSRGVRWSIPAALIVTAFLNFASLSGHWSMRK